MSKKSAVAQTAERCAAIVLDTMRHYEDEAITGTMRVALNCIAKRIRTEFGLPTEPEAPGASA